MQRVNNTEDIEFEIRKALTILKSMPRVGPEQVRSHWPKYINDDVEQIFSSRLRYYKPLPEEIDDMDEVLEEWLKCIEYDERNLVIMRNSGLSWKQIVVKCNYSRSHLYAKYIKSLQKILAYVLEKQSGKQR
jgi:hypothetical protein